MSCVPVSVHAEKRPLPRLFFVEDLKVLGLRKFVDPDLDIVVDDPRDGDPRLVAVGIAGTPVIITVEDNLDASRPAADHRANDDLRS